VDPKRDTPERLARYVKSFSPTFTGITGEPAAMQEFALKMGVPVAISEQAGGNYTVDHSAAIFVVDPNGALRALSSTPHEVPVIAEDYRSLVAAYPPSS
jgi:protein SCO1/2